MSKTDPIAQVPGPAPGDRAAEWIARLRAEDCSGADWKRFCDWRDADEANGDIFARYMARWNTLDELTEEPEIVRMRLEALALEPEVSRRSAWLVPLAASIVLTVATGLFMLASWSAPSSDPAPTRIVAAEATTTIAVNPGESGEEVAQGDLAEEHFVHSYRSAVGQRSKVDLPDGSTIELNTDTVIEVDFTPQRREFRLVRGEALFDVFPDASRPFIVNSDQDRVIALGTVFSVRKVGKEIVVSLFEGKVQVERLAGSRLGAKALSTTRLDAGQQLATARGLRDFRIRPVDAERALGWRNGRLVFDNDRLSDVVNELNRYSVRKLALGDLELAGLRVSGTFRTGSADAFAAALAIALPVSVVPERESGKIVLYAAGKKPAER